MSYQGQSRKTGETFYAGRDEKPNGSWDLAGGTGTVAGSLDSFQFDTLKGTNAKKSFKLAATGLELSHEKVYLTGVIKPAKRMNAKALHRQRLAVIAHPRLAFAPGLGPRNRPLADSFLFTLQGTATVMPALSAAIVHARCTGRNANPRGAHIRTGSRFVKITAALLPTAATGAVTAASIGGGGFGFSADGNTIPVMATDGVTRDADGNLNFAPPTGARSRMTCLLGFDCVPAPGEPVPLPGTLTYSYQGRSAVLAGLVVSLRRNSDAGLVATVTGTLDGAQVTVADTPPGGAYPRPTAEFLSRMGDALGATVTGLTGAVVLDVGSLGPL